jgi:hypothetical protein
MKSNNITQKNISSEKITRKEALTKAGKYAAFTAASMMLILDKASAQNPHKSRPAGPPPSI